ncbi:MAG: hypothetical protein ACLFM7_09020, partial [Bacteroidales bacterium]
DLNTAGFEILNKENITGNVVKALDLDHARRKELIQKLIPKFLQGGFKEFAGAKGTQRYKAFASGEMQYWMYLLKKAN